MMTSHFEPKITNFECVHNPIVISFSESLANARYLAPEKLENIVYKNYNVKCDVFR